jgi:hypothetical protein
MQTILSQLADASAQMSTKPGEVHSEIPYTTRATAEIELIVGFGHTPLPADFRTAAQVERDREQNAAGA